MGTKDMVKSCSADNSLSLNDDEWESLPETVLSDLQALDANHDHRLTFKEAQGAQLTTPGESHPFDIYSEKDWRTYTKIISSWCHTTRAAQRFGRVQSYANGHEVSAETWLVARETLLNEVSTDRDSGITTKGFFVEDTLDAPEGHYLLVRFQYDCEEEDFYLTLKLPKKSDPSVPTTATLELGGQVYSVAELLVNSGEAGNPYTAYMKLLGRMLNEPVAGIPDDVRLLEARKFEALVYQASLKPTEKTQSTAETVSKKDLSPLKERFDQYKSGQWSEQGFVNVMDAGSVYTLPVVAERSLSETEHKTLAYALEAMPDSLMGVLAIDGTLQSITIGVVNDDVMDAAKSSTVGAEYDKYTHQLTIRRSALADTDSAMLIGQLKHEFGHAIFSATGEYFSTTLQQIGQGAKIVEESDDYFIQDFYRETQERAATSPVLPTVSLYSLNVAADFFTECVVAYLNGEEDVEPYDDPAHGPKTRAELREYQPEFYVALMLFLEPASSYYGDKEIFKQESRLVINKILNDPHGRKAALSQKMTPAILASLYEEKA